MAKKSKIARQETLPTMSDAKITAIENAALNYVEGRDERMEATTREVELKEKLIEVMHKHEKTEYRRGKISVRLVVEKESVKVKVSDDEDVTNTTVTVEA